MLSAIQDAIVHISNNAGPGKPLGLGILCGEFILTCAHFCHSFPTDFADLCMFTATRVSDGAQGDFAVHVASTMDLMALAPNAFTCASGEDAGPTSSAWDLVNLFEEQHPPLRPASLSFAPGRTSGAVSGFFFAPDGKTLCRTVFTIHDGDAMVWFQSDAMSAGCSGSPLVTDDMRIIGIAANRVNIGDGSGRFECIGRRIDLCVPVYLQRLLNWECVVL